MSSFKSNENIHKKEDGSKPIIFSQNIHSDLKAPKIKYKLHYGWFTGRRFTAATRHNTSCGDGK